jgi:hypothetical protein
MSPTTFHNRQMTSQKSRFPLSQKTENLRVRKEGDLDLDNPYVHTRLPTPFQTRKSIDFQFTNQSEELKNALDELSRPEENTFRPMISVTSSMQTVLPHTSSPLKLHPRTPSNPSFFPEQSPTRSSLSPGPRSQPPKDEKRSRALKRMILHLETDARDLIDSGYAKEALGLLTRAQQLISAVYYRQHPQHV